MQTNLKQWFVAIVLLIAGIFVGRILGSAEAYKKMAGTTDAQVFREAAVNLRSHLTLLELLQAKQTDKAVQTLDRLLDVDLMAVRRYPHEQIREQNPQLLVLVEKANQYRQQHPSKTGGR